MQHPTDRITHTTAFVTPVEKDRSNDLSHHGATFRSMTSGLLYIYKATHTSILSNKNIGEFCLVVLLSS